MSAVLFSFFASFRNSNPGLAKRRPISLLGETRFLCQEAALSLTLLFLIALLGVTFTAGCGSSGPPISVNLSPSSTQSVQQGQTVSISATLGNDASNKGVTWSLSATGCTGAACGSLTNQAATSVTYNAPTSIPSDLTVTVTATSVTRPMKFASLTITVPATVVTIQNKVTKLAAGTGNYLFARFDATVQNDPANAGVTWTLTASGTPCSPACGTLSTPAPYEVNYAPPASVPGAPNNMPTLTAISASSTARSDTDSFTIFDGSAACATGGNESLLNGQYAIMLQGWSGTGTGTPIMYAASFAADGTGKVTGGQDQLNPYANFAYSGAGIIPSASSYSVGPDNRGCLTLTDQEETTFTFRFTLGGVSGGIASKGDIIFVNEQSSTPEHASGILRRQDPTAFSLSALAPNYALGLEGWNKSSGTLTHFAQVGSFAHSGGTLSALSYDQNDGSKILTTGGSQVPGNFGMIGPIATGTGGANASLNLAGISPDPVPVVVYVISSSELFFVSMTVNHEGPEFSGRAIATSSSFSASSIAPNYIFRFIGNSSGAACASIGLASFSTPGSPGISGTVSGTMDQYAGGMATSQNLSGSYALTGASGRLSITGSSLATSPVCYLANPLDGVAAFCMNTDSSASFGIFDIQPATTYSSNSLSGNFYFGSGESGDNSAPDLSGVVSLSSGSLQGAEDKSTSSGFSLAIPVNATLSINADGSGNLGANTVALTNGTVLYLIDETGTSPPLVRVFEQ
ncbi:MAG: hypothetical protein DMG36_00025 [Acidobacteria bacterium]|nr:MAG: hypothetical protein DMG36_00025 [Acidobacteriota bacterium]